jgi:hypothetical protein
LNEAKSRFDGLTAPGASAHHPITSVRDTLLASMKSPAPAPAPAPGSAPASTPPPPRAFTQGLGQVFQVVGVLLFLAMMFVCCGSSLLSKETATHTTLTRIGWHQAGDPANRPSYSAQRAISVSLFSGVFFGIALAGVGLGMQAEYVAAAAAAVLLTILGSSFWIVHALFAATVGGSILFTSLAGGLALVFVLLLAGSVHALVELRRTPPPADHALLPADYKIPYSHYHEDPPEVRLERELQQRRQRLHVQQKELEMLEARLRQRLKEKPPDRPRE